jgi:hypothetical protein
MGQVAGRGASTVGSEAVIRQQNPQKRVAVPAGGTVTVRFELQP